jgi:hypothetical protein
VYGSYVMLRTAAPQDMTAAEQREAGEQLGRVAASLARGRRRLARRARGAAVTQAASCRQPAPPDGTNAEVGRRQFQRECANAGGYALNRQSR